MATNLIAFSLDNTVADALIAKEEFGKGNVGVNEIGPVARTLKAGLESLHYKAQALGGKTVATKAALTALTKANLAETLTQLGEEASYLAITVDSDADGKPRTYRWDSTSAQTASQSCLATNEGGTGRWIALDVRGLSKVQTAPAAAADRVTATAAKTAFANLGGIIPVNAPVGTRINGKAIFKLASTNGSDTCEPTVEAGSTVLVVRSGADLANDDIVSLAWDYVVSATGASGKLTGHTTVQLAGAGEVNTPVVDLAIDLSEARTVTPKVTHGSSNAGNQTDLRYLKSEIAY
jgi:hypothetical protein